MPSQLLTGWSSLVVSCPANGQMSLVVKELEALKKRGLLDASLQVLCIEDPAERIGSGGATINALWVLAESLSARRGHTVVNPEVLRNEKTLLLHVGRPSVFDSCGKALVSLPAQLSSAELPFLTDNLVWLLHLASSKIPASCPSGAWVCSTDMLLCPSSDTALHLPADADAVAVAVPTPVSSARSHGVYRLSREMAVEDILYGADESELQACVDAAGLVPLVCGLVFLSTRVLERLVEVHSLAPLDACSYLGLDAGSSPIQLSLFFDVLLSLCSGVDEQQFVHCSHRRNVSVQEEERATVVQAKRVLWRQLHGFRLLSVSMEGEYHYLDDEPARFFALYQQKHAVGAGLQWRRRVHSVLQDADGQQEDVECVSVNSVVERGVQLSPGCVLVHSHLDGELRVGEGCFVSSLCPSDVQSCVGGVSLSPDVFLQGRWLRVGSNRCRVFVVLGRRDELSGVLSFCNRPWSEFLSHTGIRDDDLWPADTPRALLDAQLFPAVSAREVTLDVAAWLQGSQQASLYAVWRSSWRLSLRQIVEMTDYESEWQHRRSVFHAVSRARLQGVLTRKEPVSVVELLQCGAVDGEGEEYLRVLDSLCSSRDPSVSARGLACIADLLGAMAGPGLRSGPASNCRWRDAFSALESGDMARAVRLLARERARWLGSASGLLRASRHYEGAAALLIRQAVCTARQFISTERRGAVVLEQWVCVECPARIDLSGGWSDTPPIAYEFGGAVTNVSIRVNGRKPIGARVRVIAEPVVRLCLSEEAPLELRHLDHLRDHGHPMAAGALPKTALLFAGVLDLADPAPLSQQLLRRVGGGVEVHTWAQLPHGSGLGTSSILAGAIIAALWRLLGVQFDDEALLHAVLMTEQLMTTGGGWQDQVGGLIGGFKMGQSAAALPLHVTVRAIPVSAELVGHLERRLLLLYTGKTRLAKNLLQNVLRTWFSRTPAIVSTCQQLVDVAHRCERALLEGDVAALGACVDEYWQLKKRMAPGCEPEVISRMMALLRPHVHGQALAGAGGGGFLVAISKEADVQPQLASLLAQVSDDVVLYSAHVDTEGASIRMEACE